MSKIRITRLVRMFMFKVDRLLMFVLILGIMVAVRVELGFGCPPPDCGDCWFWNGYYCQKKPWVECDGWCGSCCICQNCQCVESQGCPNVGNCSRNCEKSWGYCACAYCRCWEPDGPIEGLPV